MLIRLLAVAAVTAAFVVTNAIPQDPDYFVFADSRTLLNVPNFWNVVSNIGFLIAGVWGLIVASRLSRIGDAGILHYSYLVFFAGIFLTTFGSAWFHLEPSNGSLFWDRLPMTVSFAGLFAAVIGEFLSRDGARRLLWPFLIIGIGSVIYWQWTESRGIGDLRPYALVQFLPMIAIPVILMIRRDSGDMRVAYWLLIAFYVVAKLTEFFDVQVFDTTGVISGHSLKHLLAAAGPAALIFALARRTRVGELA